MKQGWQDWVGPRYRIAGLGVFTIFFGIVIGILTMFTLVGPFFGVFLVGFGVYLIWHALRDNVEPM